MAVSQEFLSKRSRLEKWALEIADLPDEQIAELLAAVPENIKAATLFDWKSVGRPQQQIPPGDWRFWVIFPGRGWGKSKTGSAVCSQWADSGEPGTNRIALIGSTAADVRDVMVEGETGILAAYPRKERPIYRKSQRCVEWRSTGARAFCYSAEDPEQLRGPQHGKGWADELAAWKHADETWRQFRLGLRLGVKPQGLVTTTPKAIPIIKSLVAKAAEPGSRVAITRGSTYDNILSLPDDYIQDLSDEFAGTRFGRQEVYGEVLEPVGALFNPKWFKYLPEAPAGGKTVVAIDPATGRYNDETGIVVVKRVGDKAYVLADLSGAHSPEAWAKAAIGAFRKYNASAIVVEENKIGELGRSTIRMTDKSVNVEEVHAPGHRGGSKESRAEPVAALYELGRVFHCGQFAALEDQMVSWDPTQRDGQGRAKGKSPDRMDALVWAISKLGFHLGVARGLAPGAAPTLPTSGF